MPLSGIWFRKTGFPIKYFGNDRAKNKSRINKEDSCQPGEKVNYPRYGKAIIEALEEREVMGVVRPYYILKCLERDATIMIPENMIELAGLRRKS